MPGDEEPETVFARLDPVQRDQAMTRGAAAAPRGRSALATGAIASVRDNARRDGTRTRRFDA